MGQLLLQGWTMLGESCNGIFHFYYLDCALPLMRNKQKKLDLCVGCNRNYAEEEQKPS